MANPNCVGRTYISHYVGKGDFEFEVKRHGGVVEFRRTKVIPQWGGKCWWDTNVVVTKDGKEVTVASYTSGERRDYSKCFDVFYASFEFG